MSLKYFFENDWDESTCIFNDSDFDIFSYNKHEFSGIDNESNRHYRVYKKALHDEKFGVFGQVEMIVFDDNSRHLKLSHPLKHIKLEELGDFITLLVNKFEEDEYGKGSLEEYEISDLKNEGINFDGRSWRLYDEDLPFLYIYMGDEDKLFLVYKFEKEKKRH